MPAIASIAIQDGLGTPQTHTFTPRQTNPALYRNSNSDASASGVQYDETLLVDVRINPTGISKVNLTMKVPHSDSSVSPAREWFEQVKVEFFLSNLSTVADRKDIRTLLKNLLADAQIVAVVDNLEFPY